MKKWIIIIVIVVVILGTISFIAKKQIDKALKYCYNYNIKKSKVETVNEKEIKILFAIDFKNTSDIDVDVNGYKLDILLNDIKVSEVNSTTQSKIKNNAFTTLIVPIKLDIKKLISNKIINADILKNILFDKSKISITTKGTVSASALGVGIKDFPIEIKMTLAEMLAPSTEPETVCK